MGALDDPERSLTTLSNRCRRLHVMTKRIEGLVERFLVPTVHRRMEEEPVVVLVGPRSVGKSTLLRGLAADLAVEVYDLDDPQTRDAVNDDPGLFASGPAPVLIDEFQKVPAVLDAIKSELNRSLVPGRFVLTGSTRYETLPRAAQSLTGRAHVMSVLPLSQGEIDGNPEAFLATLLEEPDRLVLADSSPTSRSEYIQRVSCGGFPLALARSPAARPRWFASYLNLVIERDVVELSRIRQRTLLPRLLTALVAQTGGLLNMAAAARRAGMEERTAENYTKLLEAVFLIRLLPAWGTTLGAKAGAVPKIHAVDSGLAAHLLRLTPEKLARRSAPALTEFGHLLETFAVGEIFKQMARHDDVITLGHWRTRDGAEVDLIVERSDGAVAGIEVKAGARVNARDFAPLASLADKLADAWLGGVVLHTGQHAYTHDASRRLHALPLDRLWRPPPRRRAQRRS